MELKLFPKEYYDQQREKHKAYLKAGFELISQRQDKNQIIKRIYSKGRK